MCGLAAEPWLAVTGWGMGQVNSSWLLGWLLVDKRNGAGEGAGQTAEIIQKESGADPAWLSWGGCGVHQGRGARRSCR